MNDIHQSIGVGALALLLAAMKAVRFLWERKDWMNTPEVIPISVVKRVMAINSSTIVKPFLEVNFFIDFSASYKNGLLS